MMHSRAFHSTALWLGLGLQLTMTAGFSDKFAFSSLAHPGFDNYDILPPAWVVDQENKNSIGGMALLPDGRLATAVYKGGASATNRNGQMFILSGVVTATKRTDVTVTALTGGLREPLGVAAVNGNIYVIEKDRLGKFTPNGANWTYAVEYDKHNPVAVKDFYHWFSMGLVYHQGKFNWTLGGFTQYTKPTAPIQFDPEPVKHGTWVQYDPVTNTHEFLVHGLRNTGGTSLGPDGTICTSDNQGEWEPSDKFICMEKGKWYGWDGPDALAKLPGQVETPPTAWGAHDEITNSLGESVLIPKGKYAGQMFITDLNNGVLNRVFMEKVRGQWQGAFTFLTGGFKAGVYRVLLTPDSTNLILAGIGGWGGWRYLDNAPAYACLHKLVPNTRKVLEILAVRSMSSTKMEVEFTEPVNQAAALATGYKVTSWKNIANENYGGGRNSNQMTHTVSSVSLSADNLKATLTMTGLEAGRIVRIFVNPPVRALSGDTLWFKYSDYTLNNFGPAETVSLERMVGGHNVKPFEHALKKNRNGLELNLTTPGAYAIEITTMQGVRVRNIYKEGPISLCLTQESLGVGVFMLRIKNHSGLSISEKFSML